MPSVDRGMSLALPNRRAAAQVGAAGSRTSSGSRSSHSAEAASRADRLASIFELTSQLVLGRSFRDTLRRLSMAAVELLRGEGAWLRAYDDDELVDEVWAGPVAELMAEDYAHSIRHQIHPVGPSSITVEIHPSESAAGPRQGGVTGRIWLRALLRSENRLVGVLVVVGGKHQRFSELDLEILSAFAGQAAVAIRNAYLYKVMSRRREQADAMAEIARATTSSLELHQVLALALDKIIEIMAVPIGILYLRDEGDLLRVAAHRGLSPAYIADVDHVRLGEGALGRVAATGQPELIDDVVSHPNIVRPQVRREGVHSLVIVPLEARSRVIGAMYVGTRVIRPFSAEQTALFVAMGRQVAVAIENARLYEQAATVEALRELARLKTEFLSTVSHELRTPLSLIAGYAELLKVRAAKLNSEQVAEMAGEIDTGSRTMVRLVDDLLDFARLEQGRLRFQQRWVDVASLLRRLVESFRMQPSGERVVAELPPSQPAYVDPERISQVASNLITNALRYAPTGPIAVRAMADVVELRVEVADQGPGISPEEQARIWEKFFRGAAAVTSPNRGSGLGLSVVRHLVELHGGRVGLRSAPGQGTTFWFAIPIAERGAPDPPEDAPEDAPAGADVPAVTA